MEIYVKKKIEPRAKRVSEYQRSERRSETLDCGFRKMKKKTEFEYLNLSNAITSKNFFNGTLVLVKVENLLYRRLYEHLYRPFYRPSLQHNFIKKSNIYIFIFKKTHCFINTFRF